MNISKAEQRLLEIERIIKRAEQGIKKLKSYTEVVYENERLRDENSDLRKYLNRAHEIVCSALPHDEKSQKISAYITRALYNVDRNVEGNER